MKVLALDSAVAACSAALWEDGRVVARALRRMERGQSEALLPMVEQVMKEGGWGYADLDLLAATVGPGAFTGIRIGLAAARGLALATGLPLIGVTTLEALAAAVAPGRDFGGTVLAALDTKRGDFYVQAFGPDRTALAEARVAGADDLAGLVAAEPALVVGDGAAAVVAVLVRSGKQASVGTADDVPDPAQVAAIAAARFIPGSAPPMPAPLYLRAASTTIAAKPRRERSP